MTKFFKFLLLFTLWVAGCVTLKAETAEELRTRLASSTHFRLKSNLNSYVADIVNVAMGASATGDLTNGWNSIWKIVASGNGYTLQNAYTGLYLNSVSAFNQPLPLTSTPQVMYIRPSSYASANNHVAISWDANFSGYSCVHSAGTGSIVRWVANTSASSANSSDWILEPVSVDETAMEAYRRTTTPVAGQYYYIVSNHYPTRRMQGPTSVGAAVNAALSDDAEYAQLWTLEAMAGGKYAFKNVITGLYIQDAASSSAAFTAGATQVGYRLAFSTGVAPYNFSASGASFSLHAAETANYNVVGWNASADASKWQLVPATVTADDVQAAIQRVADAMELINNRATITEKLKTFFDDYACTQLKSDYRGKTDDELRSLMQAAGLATPLQEMAVKVKNDSWNSYSDLANSYEKSFRIAMYNPHSDNSAWSRDNSLMRSSFIYSQLTSPSGITANKGDVVCIFVDEAPPTGTSLQAEMAVGKNVTGRQITLYQGANFIYAEDKEHVYIRYNINDTNLRIADLPELKIHIEAGYANGYFNALKHENQVWKDMLTLKPAGFMQDNEWRMKSNRYTHIFPRAYVENSESNGDFMYHGEEKGLKGVLLQWDALCDQQLHFLSVDRYADRFNCVLLSVQDANGNLYASTYGIYGVGALNYTKLVEGSENSEASGIWGLVHETGHHFQKLFDMQASMESSNNLFSNIALWKTGTNVSRGMSLPTLFNNTVNAGNGWTDLGLNERVRLYWQLWLYYVELGHKPNFFREVMDKFRQKPLVSGNAKTDFLYFAEVCSEVAQEDLTDFFEFYGFFRKTGTNLPMPWGNPFYDRIYPANRTTVTQADIDATKAFMAQFPTKRKNLFFLDERIRPTAGTNPYVLPGTPRYATTATSTPGDVNEVGELGHYTDYATETTARPTSAQLNGRTFTFTGEDVVGYKVYDSTGKLVYVSNRNTFDLPASINGVNLDLTTLRVVAASTDGNDVVVYENGAVKSEFDVLMVDPRFKNSADLALSVKLGDPEYLYNIGHTASKNNATRYFLNGQTKATSIATDYGQFAFYAGMGEGMYYIYSATAQKWLGYSSTTAGNNKITFHDTKAGASQWRIVREMGKTSFDIQPLYTTMGWNWYGGVTTTRTSMGLYGVGDAGTSWYLQSANEATTVADNNARIGNLLAKRGVGYPTDASSERQALAQKLSEYQLAYAAYVEAVKASQANPNTANTAEEARTLSVYNASATALTTAETAYKASTTPVMMPEDGKIYRIKFVHNGRSITNHRMPDDTQGYNILLTQTQDERSLWVCQYNANGSYYFASLKGDGCLSVATDRQTTKLNDESQQFSVTRGDIFGTLNLRNVDRSLMGTTQGSNLLTTPNSKMTASANASSSTEFFFEEVTDSAFGVSVKSGSNGNMTAINLPYAVVLPAGAKAYNATRNGSNLVLREQTVPTDANGQKILPAYTPMFINLPSAGNFDLHPVAAQTAISTTGMYGTISRVPNEQLEQTVYNYYGLTLVNGQFMMRKVGKAAIPANKAYYRTSESLTNAPSAITLLFDEPVTGVSAVTTDTDSNNSASYDLSGRRLQDSKGKGIVVVGGKKILSR